jgi:hypothetical protein
LLCIRLYLTNTITSFLNLGGAIHLRPSNCFPPTHFHGNTLISLDYSYVRISVLLPLWAMCIHNLFHTLHVWKPETPPFELLGSYLPDYLRSMILLICTAYQMLPLPLKNTIFAHTLPDELSPLRNGAIFGRCWAQRSSDWPGFDFLALKALYLHETVPAFEHTWIECLTNP